MEKLFVLLFSIESVKAQELNIIIDNKMVKDLNEYLYYYNLTEEQKELIELIEIINLNGKDILNNLKANLIYLCDNMKKIIKLMLNMQTMDIEYNIIMKKINDLFCEMVDYNFKYFSNTKTQNNVTKMNFIMLKALFSDGTSAVLTYNNVEHKLNYIVNLKRLLINDKLVLLKKGSPEVFMNERNNILKEYEEYLDLIKFSLFN